MALIGSEYEVLFVKKDDQLIPTLVSGQRARQIILRNRDTFALRIHEGARFAASLIHMEGPARNATSITLHLERAIISVDAKSMGEDFWIAPQTLALIEADIHFGRAFRLVGPKGSGKTTFAAMIAKILKVPYIKVDGTGIFKPKDLFGAESAEKASTKWVQSDLSVFIEQHRASTHWPKAIVCLDEFSRMGHSMAPFHSLFDHTGQFSFTTTQGTIVIDGLHGFIFILTDNPVGPGYIGNQQLDSAMEDRVEAYEFNYPPPEWEVPWLCQQTGITEAEGSHIVQVAGEIRKQAQTQGWEKGGPSPRRTLRVAQDVSIGKPMQLVLDARIINRYPDGDAQSERSLITARLKSMNLLQESHVKRALVSVKDVGGLL